MTAIVVAIILAAVALAFAGAMAARVIREDQGPQVIRDITQAIKEGALAFLFREYQTLVVFLVVVAAVLAIFIDWRTAIAYVVGAAASGLAGWIGMNIAIRANGRTTNAAQRGLNPGLRVAFSGGTVMGVTVVGLGLLALSLLYVILQDINVVVGLGFGASSIALFARVGGGIYTKAADVGADLVGKVEAGIPEDDPRNPATIADNVGDNVGDVAGMGADLFESYVGSIIAAIAIAATVPAVGTEYSSAYRVLPLAIAAAGIAAGIIGTFFVRASEQAGFSTLLWALRRGIFLAAGLVAVFSLIVVLWLGVSLHIFWSVLMGLAAGVVIGVVTEYYTSYEYKPTKFVAEQTQTGPATTIIGGFATAMQSTVVPVVAIAVTIIVAYLLSNRVADGLGFYGVAVAAVGMLSTLGITLATDAYGPIADNAGGIAEQARLDPQVRERTDALDSLGNTTAATGKGFAIGSAALTALALMAAYAQAVGLNSVDILDYRTLVGLLLGAMLPFVFSALTMKAVSNAAFATVNEVRRQFREIPGIMEGTGRPEYARCVDISTRAALKAMILPSSLAVLAPLAVGFILGEQALGGLLVGAIIAGFLLAVTMANAGSAWDNAKKYVELGHYGGKGSEAHKAGVVGDTVGDPFKDTSGPSLNILLKLMSIVALVFAPLLATTTALITG